MGNNIRSTEHHYSITVTWTGNDGVGTAGYRAFRRDHEVSAPAAATTIHGLVGPGVPR